MARLRLFANLREAAGTRSAEFPGRTVAEVVAGASAVYGEVFAAGVAQAGMWVNGEPADPSTLVDEDDEVALIPPVSGGEIAVDGSLGTRALLASMLVAALLLASLTSLEAFVIALVAVAAMWVWDLAAFAAVHGVALNAYPLMLAVVAPAWAAYRWGFSGFAFSVVLTVTSVLVSGIFRPQLRVLTSIAPTALAGLMVASGVGSLVLLRMRGESEINAFVLIVAAAVIATWGATRIVRRERIFDPNIAALGGAVIAGAIAGAFWGPSWAAVFVASVFAAVALVSGWTIGSVLRSGRISLAETAPGQLTLLDGPIVAAGVFWVALILLT